MVSSQKVGVVPGMFKNSMEPEKSDAFVPPSVKTPPDTSWVFGLLERVSQKLISGADSWLFETRVCQKGVAPVLAIALNARPMMPETVPSRRPVETVSTLTMKNPQGVRIHTLVLDRGEETYGTVDC